MKAADRFRLFEALYGIAREHASVSIEGRCLRLTPLRGYQLTSQAKSLCRELTEAYQQEPQEVGAMIAGRRAA
jgi:hypothetical protein